MCVCSRLLNELNRTTATYPHYMGNVAQLAEHENPFSHNLPLAEATNVIDL